MIEIREVFVCDKCSNLQMGTTYVNHIRCQMQTPTLPDNWAALSGFGKTQLFCPDCVQVLTVQLDPTLPFDEGRYQ